MNSKMIGGVITKTMLFRTVCFFVFVSGCFLVAGRFFVQHDPFVIDLSGRLRVQDRAGYHFPFDLICKKTSVSRLLFIIVFTFYGLPGRPNFQNCARFPFPCVLLFSVSRED